MNSCSRRHPVEEHHVTPLEHQPQLLSVHPTALVKAVVEVDEGNSPIAESGLDVLFDHGPGPDPDLGRLNSPRSKPAGEQVEEVDPVLDENAAAVSLKISADTEDALLQVFAPGAASGLRYPENHLVRLGI